MTRNSRSFASVFILLGFIVAIGCGGGGGLGSSEKRLTGAWVAEKLNADGNRTLLVFNETPSSLPTGTSEDFFFNTNNTSDQDQDPRTIRVAAVRPTGVLAPIDAGIYRIQQGQIAFDLSLISDFSSTFSITSASGNQQAQLILGEDTYHQVSSVGGPLLGGQIQIPESVPDESVRVSSVKVQSEFVPGEVLVKYREEPSEAAGLSLSPATLRQIPSIARSEVREGYHKIILQPRKEPSALQVSPKGFGQFINQQTQAMTALKEDTRKMCETLRQDSNVEYCVPNAILKVQSLADPTDPRFDDQWNLDIINTIDAWTSVQSARNAVVAVVDTGIVSHPDLTGRVLLDKGFDFTSDRTPDFPDLDLDATPGPDRDPTDPGDRNAGLGLPGGSSWHGTHIAGIIAAAIDNGTGISGIVPRVQILPLRAIGFQGNGTLDDVAQAIYYAAKLPNVGDCGTRLTNCVPDASRPKADVINLSLGALLSSEDAVPLNRAIDSAAAQGVLVVAAAGNEASGPRSCVNSSGQTVSCSFYPAANPNVLSIGAVFSNLQFASSYSNFGGEGTANSQFLVAPGGSVTATVLSTVNTTVLNGYAGLIGTSQAAAHVSGVAALMKSERPSLTVEQLKQSLRESAIDLGATGRDKYYGFGLLNACGALLRSRQISGLSTSGIGSLRLSSQNVDFGALGSSHTVLVQGGCGQALTGITATKRVTNGPSSWLQVSLTSGSTPSQLKFQINRAGLSAGTYTGSVTVNSSAGSQTVNVTMNVVPVTTPNTGDEGLREEIDDFISGDTGIGGFENSIDLGEMLVLLVNAETLQAVAFTRTDFNANYLFQFGGTNPIPPGQYYLLAGVDENQDAVICREGDDEPCLAYPTYANPEPIAITSSTNRNDIVIVY